jgi:hypothetical protein
VAPPVALAPEGEGVAFGDGFGVLAVALGVLAVALGVFGFLAVAFGVLAAGFFNAGLPSGSDEAMWMD